VAKHADEQGHRNQRRFPEEVEDKQVEGNEDAEQRSFHHQKKDKKFLHPLLNGSPGNQHAKWSKKCGEHHQPHGDAIDSEVVMNIWSSNPCAIEFKVESRFGLVKVHQQVQGKDKRQQRNPQCKPANLPVSPR
jgi:hypothetical protein